MLVGGDEAWFFFIRVPKIQKRGAKTCSYWFLFFSIQTSSEILLSILFMMDVSIEKSHWTEVEKRGQLLFWVIFFSFDIPIMNYIDWCFNGEKEKSPWTEVGFPFLNHFIDSCSFSSFQKPKALDCGSNGSIYIEFLTSLTTHRIFSI